jgi:HEAT repeat protein
LQRDAFLELLRARASVGLLDRPETVARFAGLVDDRRLPLARRAALLQLLAGRPGFDAEGAFVRLAGSAQDARERQTLVRQLGASDLAPVGPWLARQAASPDAALRRAAVAAQGRRGAAADLGLLARALSDPDDGVARSALRALGSLDSEPARRLLAEAAAGSDPVRARWAAAELRR